MIKPAGKFNTDISHPPETDRPSTPRNQAPRLKTVRKHESAAIGHDGFSSPNLNRMSDSNHNAPTPPGKVPPLKITDPGTEAVPPAPAESGILNPVTKEAVKHVSSNEDNHAEYPFQPNLLGKLAIKSRTKGRTWIGKASDDSLAIRLQRTMDQLIKANEGKINAKACMYLQEIFGLLPAGAKKANRAFNYSLSASFYSLGLNADQWRDIAAFYQDFDTLDVSADPEAAKEFKMQLREIIAAKDGLLFLKEKVKEREAEGKDV